MSVSGEKEEKEELHYLLIQFWTKRGLSPTPSPLMYNSSFEELCDRGSEKVTKILNRSDLRILNISALSVDGCTFSVLN